VLPPELTEMVTGVELVTGLVMTVKVAVVPEASTMTLAGTVATVVLLLVSDTIEPPLGAGPVKTTVPWEVEPPTTLVGVRSSELTVGGAGFTVRAAVIVLPPEPAEMVTGVELVTGLVVSVKVAVVLAAGTVTLTGTATTLVLLLVSDTIEPSLGAGPVKTTVPWEVEPPTTLVGVRSSELTVGGAGFTVRIAPLVLSP